MHILSKHIRLFQIFFYFNIKREKILSLYSGVYASVDDEGWPTLKEVRAPKIRPFSSLSEDEVYLIVDYKRINETYRGESRENLHLILREKDRSKPNFQCRATGIVKKSLETNYDFYKKLKSHNFFITHNGQKASQHNPGNEYNDFSKIK